LRSSETYQGNKTQYNEFRKKLRKPKTAEIILGYRCNFRCQHCGVDAGPNRKDKLNEKLINEYLKGIQILGFKEIFITGGEPTLYMSYLKQIFSFAKKHEIEIRLNTNGSWITDKDISRFIFKNIKETNGRIFLSIDDFHIKHISEDILMEAVYQSLLNLNECHIITMAVSNSILPRIIYLALKKISAEIITRETIEAEGYIKQLILKTSKGYIFIDYHVLSLFGRAELLNLKEPPNKQEYSKFPNNCPNIFFTLRENGTISLCGAAGEFFSIANNWGLLEEGSFFKIFSELKDFTENDLSYLKGLDIIRTSNIYNISIIGFSQCELCYEFGKRGINLIQSEE